MQTVRIDLQENRVTITPAPGKEFDLTSIPEAIKNAGFVPDDMYIVAEGKIIEGNGSSTFQIKNWSRTFPVKGNVPGGETMTLKATVQFQKDPPVLLKRE